MKAFFRIQRFRNLIRKKHTSVLGYYGVLLSRGLSLFVTLESDFHPPTAPNEVI
jgi:hypothetical protein